MATKIDSRQVVLRAQSPFIGNAANEQLDVVFPRIDAEMAKLYEDRNVMLQNGGIITFTGTQIQFTEDLEIVLNQKISGAAPQVINLGSANVDLNDGEMWYAVIDRTAGTATTSVASTLPAVVAANQEVFLIVKRVDAGDGTQRIYWRSGMAQNAGQSNRLGASGSGGSGSGVGDDLGTLLFKASFTDGFDEGPTDVKSAVNTSAGFTDPTTYNAAKAMYTISYDASKTIAVGTTTTNIELSAVASFTVKIGDIVIANGQARRITAVASQQSFTTEAFTTAPTLASQVTVSQAIYSKDLNNFAVDGLPISDAFSTTISQILLTYEDTTTSGDNIFDANTVAVVGYSASSDNSSFTDVSIRPQLLSDTQLVKILPTASTSLYLRFFANKTSGSGTVNLLGYKAFLHKFQASEDGAIFNQAYGRTDGTGTDVSVNAVSVVGGKTRIKLDWAFPVGVNPGKANGPLIVWLDGQKIPRFVDATVSISAYYTEIDQNTIELDADYSSMALEFEIVQIVAVVDASDTNSTGVAQLQEISNESLQAFVKTSSVLNATTNTGTPAVGTFHSTVQNRAPIADLTQDLKARMGIERMMFQEVYPIQNEFGPAGETVYGISNDLFGQVRIVGEADWTVNSSGEYVRVGTNAALNTGYIEITFYGTGLNILTKQPGATHTAVYSVDGGAESANFITTMSTILEGRNYSPNPVQPVVSGLTLGVHTVKIRNTGLASFHLHGIEILNIGSTISVNPGIAYLAGKKLTTSTQAILAYNSTFESGSLGTRGGRVVIYQKADGSIAKAVQATDASALTFTSTNHQNEEIARVYNFREFGSGRSDDFSTLGSTSGSKAFTLDDGTTTLAAINSSYDANVGEALTVTAGTGNFSMLTFVGTGLDVELYAAVAGFNRSMTFSIDGGASIGTVTYTTAQQRTIVKIASGLPYGTHTVKFSNGSGALNAPGITRFIVYQPKKPTVPAGAVELADYNVMANFANNSTQGAEFIATGVLRKAAARELVYVGTYTDSMSPGAGVNGAVAGYRILGATAGNTIRYTFFGTGFDIRLSTPVAVNTFTVSVDGSTNLSSYSTGFYGQFSSFVAATGVATSNGTGQFGNGLWVSGIPLGLHTVVLTANGASSFGFEGIDIITPIHSNKSNLTTDIQNSLLVGSNCISDNRKITPLKDARYQLKNISQAFGVVSNPSTTSTTLVPMPDMNVTHFNRSGRVKVSYNVQTSNANIATSLIALFMDGVQVGTLKRNQYQSGGAGSACTTSDSFVLDVSPGHHTFHIMWATTSGTHYVIDNGQRTLLVEEA